MTNIWATRLVAAAALTLCGTLGAPGQAPAQTFSLSPDMQAKVDSHPHVRKITDWGSRADWSPDSKRLLFVSREYGDIFELDVASGKTRPLTFHYSHDGVMRAYYLQDGNILVLAQRDHKPGADKYGRYFGSEMWLLKSDLSGPAMPLNEPNLEGVAVSRSSMKIAWGRTRGPAPAMLTDEEIKRRPAEIAKNMVNQIWVGDVQSGDTPGIANKRMVLDCASSTGALAEAAAKAGLKCSLIEPQNFVPGSDDRLTFSMVSFTTKGQPSLRIGAYVVDLKTGKISPIASDKSYAEVEGVFPDGKSTLVEYSPEPDVSTAAGIIDLWQFPIDGRGSPKPVTRYNAIDPHLKSNQGVISPDGRWMAFGVATDELEKRVPGQGVGIFLMDLKAAGF